MLPLCQEQVTASQLVQPCEVLHERQVVKERLHLTKHQRTPLVANVEQLTRKVAEQHAQRAAVDVDEALQPRHQTLEGRQLLSAQQHHLRRQLRAEVAREQQVLDARLLGGRVVDVEHQLQVAERHALLVDLVHQRRHASLGGLEPLPDRHQAVVLGRRCVAVDRDSQLAKVLQEARPKL